jgi:hypothetical protein
MVTGLGSMRNLKKMNPKPKELGFASMSGQKRRNLNRNLAG